LFGPLGVYQGQRVVIDEHFTRRKARALLALLWLQRGRWLPSEEIIETLWPEAEPALGRGRLRQTVLVLRSAIEPPQEPGAGWRYIMEREGAYCFNPTADASSDVDEFERAIDQARAARRVADPDAALASYERAIDLHRSELLPEFRSEEWVAAESARLEEFYRQALEEAGDLYGARGDHARAVELLRQVIREDPLRERPYLSLMRFLWFQGQHVEALRVYQQLRDVLATALQVAPEPEATDLAEAIRRDRPIDG
jgi:DNA-binding SARP family transcriptional activator